MSGDSLAGGRCSRFYDSQVPPVWLRILLWGPAPALVIFGAVTGRDDGAVWAAVMMALILVFVVGLMEFAVWFDGGICVNETRLWVGRRRSRSVALADLDLDTLRFEAAWEIYDVYGKGRLMSNPMWLPHFVAVDGHDERGSVSVIVKTRRPQELAAALRAGVRAA